jgi:hypothetical protein
MSGTFQGRVAFASIQYSGGIPAIVTQSGDFDSVADTGTGIFTLTLSSPIDPNEACISLAIRGGSGAAHVNSWTDTTIEIHCQTLAGAAADRNTDVTILVKPAN